MPEAAGATAFKIVHYTLFYHNFNAKGQVSGAELKKYTFTSPSASPFHTLSVDTHLRHTENAREVCVYNFLEVLSCQVYDWTTCSDPCMNPDAIAALSPRALERAGTQETDVDEQTYTPCQTEGQYLHCLSSRTISYRADVGEPTR